MWADRAYAEPHPRRVTSGAEGAAGSPRLCVGCPGPSKVLDSSREAPAGRQEATRQAVQRATWQGWRVASWARDGPPPPTRRTSSHRRRQSGRERRAPYDLTLYEGSKKPKEQETHTLPQTLRKGAQTCRQSGVRGGERGLRVTGTTSSDELSKPWGRKGSHDEDRYRCCVVRGCQDSKS